MFRASLLKTIKRPVIRQSRSSARLHAGHTLTVSSFSQSLKRRWQSTDVHAIKNISRKQIIIKSLQGNDMKAEQEVQEKDETDLVHESEIKIVQPILFFLAIGVTAFGFAAYMTMKETEDLVRMINENPDTFQIYSKVIPEEMQEQLAKLHAAMQENFAKIPYGNAIATWGNFNEAELRNIERNYKASKFLVKCYFQEIWLRETADHYGLSESMKNIIINTFAWGYGFPQGILMVLEDETLTPIPIVACMAAGFLTIKNSKRFRMGNKVYNFLRSNMMRKIPTDRLHTLATSAFWQNRSWNLTKYFVPIFFLSSSYLYPPNHQINSSKKRTAESTSSYHFIAFCITAATFANAFSLIIARIALKRARKAGNFQLAAKVLTKTPGIGAGAIAYSLMATCASLFPTFEYPQSRLSSISLAFILHEIRYVALI